MPIGTEDGSQRDIGLFQSRAERHLQSGEAANLPGNYLIDEVRQRLQSNPVLFRLVVQLPAGADPIDDPTRQWPEDRQQKKLGILAITKPSADSSSIERSRGFYPARLTDGIEPGSPLIEVRSAVYDCSPPARCVAQPGMAANLTWRDRHC